MIKKQLYYIFIALCLISCEQPSLQDTARMTISLKAEGITTISDLSVTAHDINMNRDYTDTTLTMTLPLGYYDLAVTAKGDGQPITAYKRGIALTQNISVPMEADFVKAGGSRIIRSY